MNKFLVSRHLYLDTFCSKGNTPLVTNAVLMGLQEQNDVFIFDTLNEARQFVLTLGGANTQPFMLFALLPEKDYPIFEVEADAFPARSRILPAVYSNTSNNVRTLSQPTEFKEATGLNLSRQQILAIHSAKGHRFELDYKKSSVCRLL